MPVETGKNGLKDGRRYNWYHETLRAEDTRPPLQGCWWQGLACQKTTAVGAELRVRRHQ
ncbi:MAG: hypothetical protein IKN11_09615 [Bacteroidales bacterium]|nr:hypothetical protein [Bacteroidales bacterium]